MAKAPSGMGRVLGLGFLVGAQDQGATRVVDAVSTGFDRMSSTVSEIGQRTNSLQRFGNAIDTLNFMRLSQIGDALDGIADRAGAIERAGDTQLESFGVQAGHAFRQATAGLGEYQQQVEQYRGAITSAAFNLEVDVGELTGAVSTMVRTGNDLEDYGLEVRDVAGSMQAGILTGEQLASTLTALSEGYGLGAEGARGLLDTVTALGEEFGFGADAARALPDILEATDPVLSEFTDMDVENVTESITRLATASQRALGGPFQQHMQDAIGVFQSLSGQRQALSGLLTGLGSDFPELAREIGIFSGDVDESIESVLSNPFEFAQNLQQMYSEIDDPVAMQRFQSALGELPASFRFLIEGGEESAQAIQQAGGAVENASGAFNRMARDSSGVARTFSESMDLVEDAFRTRLNRMARDHYPRFERRVIQRQRQAFDSLSETINRFASDDGPMGALGGRITRLMLAGRRGGITGLTIALEEELGEAFPSLRAEISTTLPLIGELTDGFLSAATESGPLLLALSQMGIRIPRLGGVMRLLFNPLTMIAAGFAGVYYAVENWDVIGPLLQRSAVALRDFSRRVLASVSEVDWHEVGQNIITGILAAFGAAGQAGESPETTAAARAVAEAFRNIFGAAWTMVRGLATGLWDRTIEWITSPESFEQRAQRGASAAGVALGAAMFTPMRGPILSAATSAFSGIFGRLGSSVMGMLRGGGGLARLGARGILTKIPVVGAIVGVLFDLPEIIDSFDEGGVVNGLNRLFRSVVNGLLLGIPDMLEDFLGFDFISDIFDFLFAATNIGNLAQAIADGDVGRAVFEGFFMLFNQALFGIPGMIRASLRGIGLEQAIDDIFELLGDAWEVLEDAWYDIGVPVFMALRDVWDELSVAATEFWMEIEPIFNAIGDIAEEVFEEQVLPAARTAWRAIKDGADWLWDNGIRPLFRGLWEFARDNTERTRQFVIEAFAQIAEIGVESFFRLVRGIAEIQAAWNHTASVIDAGARYIGISVRNHFLQPFLRVQDTVLSISESFEVAVANVRLNVLEMVHVLLSSFQEMASALGPLGEGISSSIEESMTGLNRQIAESRETAMSVQREASRQQDERRAEIAQNQQDEADALRRFNEAAGSYQQERSERLGRIARQEASALSGIERFRARAHTLSDRLQEIMVNVGSGEYADQAQQERRMEEAVRAARPLVSELEGAIESGTVSHDRAMNLITRLQSAAETGDVSAVREIGDTVDEMVASAEDAQRRRERRRQPEPSASRARAAGELRETVLQPRGEPEPQTIGEFSEGAVGQLTTAFSAAIDRLMQQQGRRARPGEAAGSAGDV